MRTSKVLKKFRAGHFARFCSLGHFIPFFVRHAAHQKYDGIWLDLEHRAMNDREVQALLAMCHPALAAVPPAAATEAPEPAALLQAATGLLSRVCGTSRLHSYLPQKYDNDTIVLKYSDT